jgi:large subunit ribosomal protein L29
MKAEDLKSKSKDELVKQLLDLKKEQFNLRLQRAQGQSNDTAKIRTLRRDIARVQTFLTQQAAGVKGTGAAASPKKPKKTAAKKSAA